MKWSTLLETKTSGWTILIRLQVGLMVFFPEGIQKLVFPDPLIIIMIVAIVSTKLPVLLGHDVWLFHLAQDIKRTGFWSMMHEARADLTMLLGCLYLLMVGAGRWSVDARM